MPKIRFYFAASLDGFIADPDGGVGFLDAFHDEDHGWNEFITDIGTLVMGRGTYKFVEDYGSWPHEHKRTFVLTHRPIEKPLTDLETRVVDDTALFARELRTEAKGDIWIVGGGVVMGAFLAAGEVDQIEMSLVPVAIGVGIPMYKGIKLISERFRLTKHTRYPSGVVQMTYERIGV